MIDSYTFDEDQASFQTERGRYSQPSLLSTHSNMKQGGAQDLFLPIGAHISGGTEGFGHMILW
jgi:hypothetical protein